MAKPTTSGLLSPEELQAILAAVHAHERARMESIAAGHDAQQPYQLPAQLPSTQLDQIPGLLLDALVASGTKPMQAQLETALDGVFPAAQQRANDQMSPDDFADLLDKQLADDEVQFDSATDQLKSALLQIAIAHPELQGVSLNLLRDFVGFAMGIWSEVAAVFDGLKGSRFPGLYPSLPELFQSWQNRVEDFPNSLSS
ncbi:hypothetical protein [Nocardia sp. NPDC050412]|uniref:hypothetical protein n=2 Tax=unclassified Nocardia TaxID=2637762 RepID=UPI0037AAAC0A